MPLFSHLSRRDRRQVARWADDVEVPAGAQLATEGSFAHEFFVIEEGTAHVARQEEPVAELGPGDFFGEIALLNTDHHRTASVTAATPMRLVVMYQTEFRSMADLMPAVADQLHEAIKARWNADQSR